MADINTSYGQVIILNGPSGSGKTSIQKAFQKLMMPQLWIKVGIDSLFDHPMPEINAENISYWQSPNPTRWVKATKDVDNNSVITLYIGIQGEKVAYGMNSAIAAYAKSGCDVIVDYIGYKQEWLDDLKIKLTNIKTSWVKVSIPLEILEKREDARNTSPQGHARSHYKTVYGNIAYDFEVFTHIQSPEQIALLIQKEIGL